MNGLIVPKHPTLTGCSKQQAEQLMDCKILELKAAITTDREKRIRESHTNLEQSIRLRIENETMQMQKNLEGEIRKNHDDLTKEIRDTLDARLNFLTDQIKNNQTAIADIRNMLHNNKDDIKSDLANVRESLHECEANIRKNTAGVRSLDVNIKQCISAINSE